MTTDELARELESIFDEWMLEHGCKMINAYSKLTAELKEAGE